ncbi:MAG TPA: RNA 2',3'-cyclic phosphodiesterase [bacterium]|nr:RNA 2',3'-cyclic phosphodiesterase [bacterium]HOL48948.1 RNA 2',3'-cyclic phosphodiesterase [bacterium]HPO51217.1 RNA 2',3'-cyclic phosphodiesterase [bacterium]
MRVFSGIKLTDILTDELEPITVMLAKQKNAIKIVPAKNLHITLRFLGNIHEEKYQDFLHNIQNAFTSLIPFSIDVQGIGFFPDRNHIRVIWVGVEQHPAILLIHDILERAATKIGLPPENKFHAHITIGRTRSAIDSNFIHDLETKFQHEHWGRMEINHITIFESILHQTGPEYKELVNIPIGGN